MEIVICQKIGQNRIVYRIGNEGKFEEHEGVGMEDGSSGYKIIAVDGTNGKYLNKHFIMFRANTKNG